MTSVDVVPFLEEIFPSVEASNADIVIAPSFPLLSVVRGQLEKPLMLGAQDVSAFSKGAYTGDVAAEQLVDMRVKFAIVGHSERRAQHNETNALCNEKMLRALEAGITPVYCIGESAEEKKNGETLAVVKKQLKEGLKNIDTSKVIVAYEPVWAIGTGVTPTAEEIETTHAAIRKIVGAHARILYGGSANEKNAAEILHITNVDGLLVGSASLNSHKFASIIQTV